MRIGLISDTHGLMRPAALQALQGCEHIVHAGDIGNESILEALAGIAPVTVVRGNNDAAAWADGIPETAMVKLGGVRVFVLHDAKALRNHPSAADADVVVCGHSHKPLVQQLADGRLLVNPGSAGPRRFKLPIAIAELQVDPATRSINARVVELV